ncbi:hypothetical protein ACET3Z_009314 [Daucus carota]
MRIDIEGAFLSTMPQVTRTLQKQLLMCSHQFLLRFSDTKPPEKNLNCKLYAHSLIGVGVASSLYHASKGRLRKYLRRANYGTIATATVLLMAASALVLPIQPLMVAFVKRALKDPKLKMAHNVHKMSSLIGDALHMMPSLRLHSFMLLGILGQLLVLAPATSF